MSNPSEVIDWHEAMQQCGDDEEFLHELLEDLRTELETQVTTIAGIIANPQDSPYLQISRAAHTIKGAAANLMCGQLRAAAFQLESTAKEAHEAGPTPSPAQQQAVQTAYSVLQSAGQDYANVLKAKGICS